MPINPYPSSILRDANDKFGESVSILDFEGGRADGSTDNAPALNEAIDAVRRKGGRAVYLPGAASFYRLETPVDIASNVRGITIYGDGPWATRIKRVGDMEDGKGVININGARDITFDGMLIDGDVTSAEGRLYGGGLGPGDSGFNNNPMSVSLTKNTSFWIHGASKRIRFRNMTITHTGGYSILMDGTSDYVDDILVDDVLLENNRPHFFGLSADDMNYGAWTGGIFYTRGSGSGYPIRGLRVRNLRARRVAGNVVWGHLYDFARLHSDINVTDSSFFECGLDGILFGGVIGGVASGNTFRRIGFIANSDTGSATPKFLNGVNATALDTSGLVKGVNYVNNTFLNINGGCMDLDGFCFGVVSGNSARLAKSGDIEYAEDSVASFGHGGGPVTYGCQPSNSQRNEAGEGIVVDGNLFVNMRRGAVCLAATRRSRVSNNQIIHPTDATMAPITLFNIGSAANERTYDNVIESNQIYWSPTSRSAAILEMGSALGNIAFVAGDLNHIGENQLFGNCYEFQKDADTSSETGRVLPTAATVSDINRTTIERTGDVKPKTTIRTRQGDAEQDLWNFHDDQFVDLSGRTTDPPAPAATRGGLSYRSDENQWKFYDHSSSAWVSLGGIGSGPTWAVQFKGADGKVHGSANFLWDDTVQQLYIKAIAGTNGIYVEDGFVTAKLFNSGAVGTEIAFQAGSGAFQVNANGFVSGAGEARFIGGYKGTIYKIGPSDTVFANVIGSDVYLTSKYATADLFNSSATGSALAFQAGNGTFQVDAIGNCSGGGESRFLGGYKGTIYKVGSSDFPFAFESGGLVYIEGQRMVAQLFNATATGSAIAFQANGGAFQVDGIGNCSGGGEARFLGGYKGTIYRVGASDVVFAQYTSGEVRLDAAVVTSRLFNSSATGSTLAFQAGGGTFQVDGAGNVSGGGKANLLAGYEGGSFRGAGVATRGDGIGGGAFSVWNGSSYSMFASIYSGANVQLNAHLINGWILQQGGVNVSSLFASISHNHSGVYQPIEPVGNPYMKAGDVVSAFNDRHQTVTVKDGSGNNFTLNYLGW